MNPPKTKGIVTFYSQDNSYKEAVTGTDAHGNQVEETAVAPVPTVPATSPASETTAEEIKIVPLS